MDYINDRNKHFNKKIERAFGEYTKVINRYLSAYLSLYAFTPQLAPRGAQCVGNAGRILAHNPTPQTPNPKHQTPNTKPQTPNPPNPYPELQIPNSKT